MHGMAAYRATTPTASPPSTMVSARLAPEPHIGVSARWAALELADVDEDALDEDPDADPDDAAADADERAADAAEEAPDAMELTAEEAPDAHAPPLVSAATVAAADRVFVRPAGVAVAASVVVAVLSAGVVAAWPHPRSAAGFSVAAVVAADTASAGPSGIPGPASAGAAESAPGAFAPGADPRWEPAGQPAGGCCKCSGWRSGSRSHLDSRWRWPDGCYLTARSRSRWSCCLPVR